MARGQEICEFLAAANGKVEDQSIATWFLAVQLSRYRIGQNKWAFDLPEALPLSVKPSMLIFGGQGHGVEGVEHVVCRIWL